MNRDIFIRVFVAFIIGWFFGFGMTRTTLKTKYEKFIDQKPEGLLKLVYDTDDPDHPAMGLEIASLNYILTHDLILLTIEKKGFPMSKGPIYLESKKDKSA